VLTWLQFSSIVAICSNLDKEDIDMKKILLASLITSASFCASADVVIGGDVEMNVWQQSQNVTVSGNEYDGGSNTAITFEASIEHFIPLIPNAKFGQSSVDGDYLKYTKRDYTLYYEFLDNDMVSVDAGVGISSLIDGSVSYDSSNLTLKQDFEGYIPHLYAAAEVGVVGTPLFLFAKGYGVAYSDNHMLDYSVGAQYEIPMGAFDVELQGGYRMQRFDLDGFDHVDVDAQTDGLFAGVNIDF
jgi:outer membrane protein